jgi:NAD(P)H-hydrate repair Nnr-like enzyme with NAD(P)H-hydrate epimerase domain
MSSKTLGAKAATALDKELMSTCAFSIDQLMELAGLSVSQAGKCPCSSVVDLPHLPTHA